MEIFLFTLAAIALLVAIVALIRWKVRRDWARIERRMAERDHATLQSYKKLTIPGRRSSPDTTPSSSSRCSTQGDTAAPTSWDIPAMSAIHRSAEPSGLEPTIIGGGGSFGGGGASGGWDSSSCGGSDYSSSSDSGSSCSSSSSSGSD